MSTERGKQHYRGGIEPIDFIHANELSFDEGNIVKYATRHRYKNGAEDVKKIIDYAIYLLRDVYGVEAVVRYGRDAPE